MTPPRSTRRWAGLLVVLDEHGEPMRDVLRVLPEEARLSAAAQLGATWDDLDARGYRLQAIEAWGVPMP